jgi:hypothetical protein
MRVVEFSIQHDHVHMIVEAGDARELARGVQGLAIRVAKGLNKVMGGKGKVFADRFHSRPLRTPTEVRRTLLYVLANARKHLALWGQRPGPDWTDDEYSSSAWFAGWSTPAPRPPPPTRLTLHPETWLLAVGWRRAGGPLNRHETPSASAAEVTSTSQHLHLPRRSHRS